MTTILTTLDGSPISGAILEAIAPIAAGLNATVKLLTVKHPADATPREGVNKAIQGTTPYAVAGSSTAMFVEGENPTFAEDEGQALQRLLDEGRDFLSAAGRPLTERGIKVEVDTVIDDDIVEAIVQYAREHKVDMIAMATHGHSGLRDIVHGSVAHAVLRSGIAPMFLVRPTV